MKSAWVKTTGAKNAWAKSAWAKNAWAKSAWALALILFGMVAAALPATASLTPFQQLPFDRPDVVSPHTGPAAALLERNYFQTRPPAAERRVPVCTAQMILFEKVRLAQACR